MSDTPQREPANTDVPARPRRRRRRWPWVALAITLILALPAGYKRWCRINAGWLTSAGELRSAGRPEDAIPLLGRVIRLSPLGEDRAAAHGIRAACHADLGNFDQAVADISEAIEREADDPVKSNRDRWLRGLYLLQGQRSDEAIAEFGAVLSGIERMPPPWRERMQVIAASCHYHRGAAYHANGELEQAQVDYEAAVALDPQWRDQPYSISTSGTLNAVESASLDPQNRSTEIQGDVP